VNEYAAAKPAAQQVPYLVLLRGPSGANPNLQPRIRQENPSRRRWPTVLG